MQRLSTLGDTIFATHNPYPGEGLRNHCLRLVDFAALHAAHGGIDADGELVHLAAMLHDLGLVVPPRPGVDYLARTLELARAEVPDDALDDAQWTLLEQALLYNHAMRPPFELLPVAECFRRAVQTEHSMGVRRYGVGRGAVRQVFRAHPRDNFNRVLADFFWKTGVFEPTTIPRLFFPRASRSPATAGEQ